ncbi:acyltransferase [Flavobacterium aquicola]|uniref:Transferase family hexapeptide repeat protein n=1 Tax=Flavobacterium aquicola TaxID=1682742 RepID=A0A3E0EJ01_9FLAO|nr:acyltransferase [Flavobacterium aquicola]REG98247.1 transferase family hexapeptide repeat protein [Flavobacterium aquicola]
MAGRDKFKVIKPLLNIWCYLFMILPRFICEFLWCVLMPFNGLLSKAIRYLIIKAKAKKVGDNLSIGANTLIKNWKNFSCGDNVSIHENCIVDCDAEISIGNNVSIAHATSLVAANHTWNDASIPIKYNPITKLGIVIHDDVWIGCGVRILDGVTIKRRSVVAAGAVVNKNVGEKSLVGGIPAKLIKKI